MKCAQASPDERFATPEVSICVLIYGDHASLARQAIDSVRRYCPREKYQLVVGANAVSDEARAYLYGLKDAGDVDSLIDGPANINKCPMMRRMFEQVAAERIWWFDDHADASDYAGLRGYGELIPGALKLAGLPDATAFVLNDAELAAFGARDDPGLNDYRKILVLTLGFGVGAALVCRAR